MAGADEIPNISTTRAPFPGSLTSGWNDPPTVTSANASNTTPNRPRLNLKQRVSFPLDGLRRDANTSASTDGNSSSSNNSENTMPGNTNANIIGRHLLSSSQGGPGNKPVAKVPPQVATMSAQQASNSSNALPPLPPLPPRVDASTWPVATVHPRQK